MAANTNISLENLHTTVMILFLVADKTPDAQGNINNDTKSVALSTVVAAANQNPLSLSTTGTSGAAELIGNNLNIPNYSTAAGVTTFNTWSCYNIRRN